MAVAQYLSPAHGVVVLASLTDPGSAPALACVIVPIKAIVRDECPNPGGLPDLHVIRRRDIDTFFVVDADGVVISKSLVNKLEYGLVP